MVDSVLEVEERMPLSGQGGPRPRSATPWKIASTVLAVASIGLVAAIIGLSAQISELTAARNEAVMGGSGMSVTSHATQKKTDKYRMHITAVAGKHDGAIQISQLEFKDAAGNPLKYKAYSQNNACKDSQDVDMLTDDDTATKFCILGDDMTVDILLDHPAVIGEYRYAAADDNQARDPTGFVLMAGLEGQFVEVSRLENYIYNRGAPLVRENYSRWFRVGELEPRTHWSLAITGTGGDADVVQFAEIQFKNKNGDLIKGWTASSENPRCQIDGVETENQDAEKVGDGDLNSKFCTLGKTAKINFLFKEPVVVASYRIAAADDNYARDPSTFSLIEYDVPNFKGSGHHVSDVIDYIFKNGEPLQRQHWSRWWDTQA